VALEVVFRPQAEDEALEARQWYKSRRPGLGREFCQALDGLIARIAASPLAFPRVHNETRRAIFSRFPYAVYFRLAKEAVIVLAIHGRQHPSHWRRRS
jgi:plasmid stabilization system protein ParE